MTEFIDLQRQFLDLTDKELEDTEYLVWRSESEFGLNFGWPELLDSRRVILLAEAGSGKTKEMIEQAERLVREGQFAFFVPLESLDTEPIEEILFPADRERFQQWKAEGEKPGWFFLDAVDELKLVQGKLDRALNRLSRDLGGFLDRARVIVSCRPSDWRPVADRGTVRKCLPIPQKLSNLSSAEEAFIKPLKQDQEQAVFKPFEVKRNVDENDVRVVRMLPMNKVQIKTFAEQSGVDDVQAFLEEIDRQNARALALRPLDLGNLIETWTESGSLGTLADQHEKMVTAKLKDGPDRPDSGVLSETKAERGAERLALALTLTRKRTIQSIEQIAGPRLVEGTLDAEEILADWSQEERKALLRRAVFDPATYGRIRFHHRSMEGFLAARRLLALREKGMPIKELLRLLFAEQYGVKVVLPSMRAIAAWLALWEPAVRKELIEREPETLIYFGDPGTLSLSARGDLVRAFASHYGQGNWRGLNFMADDTLRLAHPELAPVIRECWGTEPTNPDVRGLLLQLIWLGPIPDCMDLALAAARNTDWDPGHRIVAIRALLASGCNDTVRQLANEMMARPELWPTDIVSRVLTDLFPSVITVEELVKLIRVRIGECNRYDQDFSWELRQIVETIDPRSEQAVDLRNKLAGLIWHGREAEQHLHEFQSRYGHVASALAMLCERQFVETPATPSDDLMRASVIASRFGWDKSDSREPVGRLRQCFDTALDRRNGAFWAELKFTDEIIPSDDARLRLYHATTESLVGRIGAPDLVWLETALADESRSERRTVALCALIQDWNTQGRDPLRLEAIREALKGDANLYQALTQWTAPPRKDERIEKIEQKARDQVYTRANAEEQRLEDWKTWHEEMLADPAGAFSGAKRNTTLTDLYKWLEAKSDRGRYGNWDKEALVEAFGQEVADLAAKAFQDLWRTHPPMLWSERQAKAKGHSSSVWILGLQGILAEASTPGWTTNLSSDDARTATAYAASEFGEFAPFVADLTESHPQEVREVIGHEISAELHLWRHQNALPALQNLSHADIRLRRLLVPFLMPELTCWPNDCEQGQESHWEHHLELILGILDSLENEAERKAIAQECLTRYETDPSGPLALVWLRGLFRFDAASGTDALTKRFCNPDDSDTRKQAIKTFGALLGRHQAIDFKIPDPDQRAMVLGQLVRLAHAFVRPQDDAVHEGAYSPDTRDNAETARNQLFSLLLDTPGNEARRIVLELAEEKDFERSGDRLRLLARQRAATDAEFQAFNARDVTELEMRYELPPQNRDDLFTLMKNRLEDIDHDLANHDFSIRHTIQAIHNESEIQRYLALEFDNRSKGVYEVTREEEVADRNRTDIRLFARNCVEKVVIEVKIADNWTVNQLEMALREQLVGKYMRHARCKAGCLLLTYHGTKKHWIHPETGKRVKFSQLVEIMMDKARAIEMENQQDVHVTAFGLDLTDIG